MVSVTRAVRKGCIVLSVSMMSANIGHAALLTAGDAAGVADWAPVSVPVSLMAGSGESVAAIQCDVRFDESALQIEGASVGPASLSADKEVAWAALGSGAARLLISGVNMNVIPDGTVANLMFSVTAAAEGGDEPVMLDNAVFSDPYGFSIPGAAAPGSVHVEVRDIPGGFHGWWGALAGILTFSALGARRCIRRRAA